MFEYEILHKKLTLLLKLNIEIRIKSCVTIKPPLLELYLASLHLFLKLVTSDVSDLP